MKVFIVESQGCRNDGRIEGIYLHKEDAEREANKWNNHTCECGEKSEGTVYEMEVKE